MSWGPALDARHAEHDGGMGGSHAHRSRLAAVLADVPPGLYDEEAIFWAGALGVPPTIDPADPNYASFGEVLPGLQFYVQRVDAAPRIHLDIETDDVDAEVSRLEALGAVRVRQVETWWVLRDPAGMLFCVVAIQCPEAFAQGATRWE